MTGAGGMGSLPSSRLTRLLQEKAEVLKKRRQNADAATERVEQRLRLLSEVEVELPETASRLERLREFQRRSDWEAVETLSKELFDYLDQQGTPAVDASRVELLHRFDDLGRVGAPASDGLTRLAEEVKTMTFGTDLAHEVELVARFASEIRTASQQFGQSIRDQVLELARWGGEPEEGFGELERKIDELLSTAAAARGDRPLTELRDSILATLPAVVGRRDASRSEGNALLALARELSFPAPTLEEALRLDEGAAPTRWKESVAAIDRAVSEVADEVRRRVRTTVTALVATLNSLVEHGADPAEPISELGGILDRVGVAPPGELMTLLQHAREVTEEPVVGVVASMLDEVRPRLVEARQLGRDPSEVFASMNRAREALRLKIYSEALAASAEAIEKVSQLTVDLDTAREEVESLKRLVEQLAALKVPTAPFVEGIERAGRELDRVELDRARSTLRETVRTLGRESARHFGGELERLRVVSSIARERGFLPPGTEERLAEARTLLADGSFHPAGEALASIDVALRTSAGPFVARRVEEIEKGFSEVTDADLLATTRRYLADADVALRVKDDLTQSMESLKRAEHEFAVVFASQASSHLEQLEADLRLFDEMGGTGPELQRQVDEVQQIFNMGDFVKAARASQDLLARAAETKQQRAATAISHAKLALVELTQMGIDPLDLRTRFEAAQNEAREGHVVEAYRGCVGVQEEASRLRTDAEAASDYLNQAIERSKKLEESGLDVRKFRTEIDAAREAYRNLDFDGVRAHVDAVNTVLEAAAEEAEALRLVGESESLMEDARRLGIPTDINEANIADGRAAVLAGERGKGLVLIQGTHAGLLKLLHPVLEENLKSIEQDFEIARNSGLDLGEIAEVLADARRRITRKVPIGAAEQLERARTQLTESRGFLEHAERAAKRVEEAFGQAELLKVATAPMRSRAEAIDRALKDRAYPKVIDLSGSLEREILQTINQHVARTIAGLQGMLVHARQEGAPTAAAENLLSQGRQALHEGRPMDALQLAARSESEIERLGLQTRIARAAFETLETKLARFESEGIKAPLATDLFRQALAALEAHDHPKALDLVLQALDLLAEAREFHRRAREALDLADRQVQEAMELGAELNEVIGMLERARTHAKAGEFRDAIARAREATELSRWAVERLYAGSLSNVRGLLELMRALGVSEGGSASNSLDEAEASFQAKEWKKAGDALDRARSAAVGVLEQVLQERLADLDRLRQEVGASAEDEPTETAWTNRLSELRERREYPKAFDLVEESRRKVRSVAKARLDRRVLDLKDRLWVGERLGLDTTPAMEQFSESRAALDQDQLESARAHVDAGNEALSHLIQEQIEARGLDVQTELLFARDGLRVGLGNLEERLASVREKSGAGELVDAARTLIAVEEELNQRKSYHRELLNLHYLIDAALHRAADHHLDTSEARGLLDESIRSRGSDYAEAVAKARAALKLLEGLLKATEPPTAFWPFKRLPGSGSSGAQ